MNSSTRKIDRHPVASFALLSWCLTCFFVVGSTRAEPDARVPGHTRVILTYYDSYDRIPSELWLGVQAELDRLFSLSTGSVHLRSGRSSTEPLAGYDPNLNVRVNALVMPMEPAAWNLDPAALAAVVREPGKKGAIYLFVPRIEHLLGRSFVDSRARRHGLEAERAIGRMLAHELVHFMLPGSGHSERGLMAEKMDRRFLTRPDLDVDPESMFRLNLAMWERAREALHVALARELRQPRVEIGVGWSDEIRY